jgi:signal transduction histidine kinase
MIPFVRRRLFFRVIFNGIILLVVCAAAFLGLASVLLGGQAKQAERSMTDWLGALACDAYGKAPRQNAFESYPFAVAMYSGQGAQLASSLGWVGAPTPEELSRAADGERTQLAANGNALRACADGSGNYVSVGGPRQRPALARLFLSVAAIVVLVALGSIPLARSVVKPLRELVATVSRFGEGDLSARARLNRVDEIGELAAAFDAMAAKLEGRLLAEKEMLANISHELRTPLARVRVVLEMAKEDPARAASLLGEVSQDLGELEHLTTDVLAATQLDFDGSDGGSRGLRLRLANVDLSALLRQALARTAEAHPERELVLDAPDALPTLRGDPALLRRLFENLLENAMKYSSGLVTVRARDEGATRVVQVEDTGIGIEPADLARVFEPFFRTDRSRQRTTGGTGLGLALCRRIAEVHGGSISAASGAGKTTVTVRLVIDGPL